MRIELEIVEERHRSNHPVSCNMCERRFVVGIVAARSYSLDGEMGGEVVCPACIEAGPEGISERLEMQARHYRIMAEEAEELAAEGVEAPTIEELRLFERLASLWP